MDIYGAILFAYFAYLIISTVKDQLKSYRKVKDVHDKEIIKKERKRFFSRFFIRSVVLVILFLILGLIKNFVVD